MAYNISVVAVGSTSSSAPSATQVVSVPSLRTQIKEALRQELSTVNGVKGVFTTRQRFTPGSQTPALTIYLPNSKEENVATVYKRRITYSAVLEIVMFDNEKTVDIGDAKFDSMLDDIDDFLRNDFDLSGLVDACAVMNLETDVAPPQQVEGQTILRLAVKKFDISLTLTK